jgi:heptosyltransferase-1
MKILFIKLGALGDVINTLPLAITLREQIHARIYWLVEPLSYPLVSSHSSVERAILFDKKHWPQALPSVLKELQSEEFDIALDLQRLIKSGLFCLASKSARRIGFDKARCKEFTWLFPFERIAAADPTAHMAHQYLDFARYLGANPSEIRWDIPITGQIPLDLPKKYVVLNIGATTSAKRWSAAGFASLASGLLEHYAVQGVLTGGPVDTPMAQEIESLAGGSVMNLVGRTSFQDLAEIISGAAAVVTCDTGPMHLAVALGKEVIALIGPTNPKRTGPLRGRIIRQDLDCMPCNQRQCENPVCMRGISAEMVLDALEEIL